MKNLRGYKFKSKYLNYFFWKNNIIFMKVTENKNKIAYTKIQKDNKEYIVIIIDEKIKNIKESKKVRELVFFIVDKINKPNLFYTDMRLNFNSQNTVVLSNKMEIKIVPIDKKIKNALIVYNFFKTKALIEKQGFNNFYSQFKIAGSNETQTQMLKHVKGKIDDYFYIVTLKNIIRIYKKETKSELNYNAPSFKDKMLFKYFDNYFSKFAVINYDEKKVMNFISKYYITDIQSEDQSRAFVENFLLFYQITTNNLFSYEDSYKFKLQDCSLFNTRKAKKIKYQHFYRYFDSVMEKTNNYNNFMFMLETLDLTEYVSNKKNIISYFSILELLLVNGNKNISIQLQDKCISLLKKGEYSYEEIKLAYDYRSKIIHGEYEEAIKKLHQIALLDQYSFSKAELEYEIYLNFDQMIEEKLRKRLNYVVKTLIKYFIYNNQNLIKLKSS